MQKNIIIIGAGASGLFCAHLLARAGLSPLVLESGTRAGRKLSISGGGHANFSNRYMHSCNFLSLPGFCDHALKAYSPESFLDFLRRSGFSWHEKTHGRLFLAESARKLADWLEKDAKENGASFLYENRALAVDAGKRGGKFFLVKTEKKDCLSRLVILAQGSKAGGKIAGNGSEVSLAGEIGHKMAPFSPALVPMLYTADFPAKHNFIKLAGISASAKVTIKNSTVVKSWEDGILFTHNGISGPAILSASLYWKKGAELEVDFLPYADFENILDTHPKSLPFFCLRKFLPERLAKTLLDTELGMKKIAQLSRQSRKVLAGAVHNFIFKDLRKGKLSQAEVCSGGVDTHEINEKTMQSRINPDVYIIGEGMNVTGELGGYNLHWAWASAAACARSIIGRVARGKLFKTSCL